MMAWELEIHVKHINEHGKVVEETTRQITTDVLQMCVKEAVLAAREHLGEDVVHIVLDIAVPIPGCGGRVK